MKKHIWPLALLLLASPSYAQTPQTVRICNGAQPNCPLIGAANPLPVTASVAPYQYTPLTPDQHNLAITVSTALTVPATALFAEVCASGNNVNFTYDGTTTPTSSVGMPLATGQCQFFQGATLLTNLRFIQKAATATLDVTYSK